MIYKLTMELKYINQNNMLIQYLLVIIYEWNVSKEWC